MLHEEFLSAMQDKFMRGEEDEFDYSTVDTNDEYDDLKIRERDEEERYFDDDNANWGVLSALYGKVQYAIFTCKCLHAMHYKLHENFSQNRFSLKMEPKSQETMQGKLARVTVFAWTKG